MSAPHEGDRAPDFTLPDQDGRAVSLRQFRGSAVVVYFYPKDDTPGCTTEACQFNDNLAEFQAARVPVVGISRDDARSHLAFKNKYGLRLALLSDPDHQTMAKYGAWGERPDGKEGVIRSTFLVDGDGKVRRAWPRVKADGHAAEVLAALERTAS